MKKLEALVSPEALTPVRELLESRRISTFIFSNIIAKGSHMPRQHLYRGQTYAVEFDPEVKVELLVEDSQATEIANALLQAAGGPQALCKPKVLVTTVNEVIFELEELSRDLSEDLSAAPRAQDQRSAGNCAELSTPAHADPARARLDRGE